MMNNFSKEKIDLLCEEIAYCTNNNCHTGSLIKLAEFLHEHNIKKALNAINTLLYYKGYLSKELEILRKELSESLFNELENCISLSDIDKKRIKASF